MTYTKLPQKMTKYAPSRRIPLSCAQRACHSQYIPIIMDLVSDGVHSRFVSVLLYISVFLFIMRGALFVIFLSHPIRPLPQNDGVIVRDTADMLLTDSNLNTAPAELGSAYAGAISGSYVRSDSGIGLSNVTIEASVHLRDVDSVWQKKYGFEGTMYDYTGIPIRNNFLLPGFPPSVFTTPVVSGTTKKTNFQGSFSFRKLRMELGLPGAYRISLSSPNSTAQAVGGYATFTTQVDRIKLLSPTSINRENTIIELGQALPVIVFKVSDAKGRPLAGKRCALVSAPRSLAELSAFIARKDMLLPRFMAISNAVSTPTDFAGRGAFTNAIITASTLSTARFSVVCDGITHADALFEVSVVAPGYSNATWPGSFFDFRRVVIQIQQQPSGSVLEGDILPIQPIVSVFNNVSDGNGWTLQPIPNIRVIALPYQQAGLRTGTLTSPELAKELGLISGSVTSLLSNIGQQKLLADFMSEPTNSQGIARWQSLRFIRHGPAGVYTLTFAVAGVHLECETNPIDVLSSVASVTTVQYIPPEARQNSSNTWVPMSLSLNATICTYPACKYGIGGDYGSPIYQDVLEAYGVTDVNSSYGPSGYFATPPTLRITDSLGRVLAGKMAHTRVYQLSTTGQLQRTNITRIQEYPYDGSTTSVLSTAEVAAAASEDGVLQYVSRNLAVGDTAALRYAGATGQIGSYLRTVYAPAGLTNNLTIAFDVEGVESSAIPFSVLNLDQPTTQAANGAPSTGRCAVLELLSQPSNIFVAGGDMMDGNAGIVGEPFRLRALDSFGNPVATQRIEQHLVDFLGIATMRPFDSPYAMAISPEYVTYLRRMGGGATIAMGNFSAIALQQLLLPRLFVNDTDEYGNWTSDFTGLQTVLKTYVRYTFVAYDTGPFNDTFDVLPVSACFSPYTAPIPTVSNIAAIEWQSMPATANVTCLADGETPLTPKPQPIAYRDDGSVAEGIDSTGVLLTAFSSDFTLYPAHQGVIAREFSALAIFQDGLGFPAVRLPGDKSGSVMLPPVSDKIILGNVNPLLQVPFTTLSQNFLYQFNASLPPESLGPTGVIVYTNMSNAVIPGKVIAELSNMALLPGGAGLYRFVAYSQGVVSDMWTPVQCTGSETTVVVEDYAAGAASMYAAGAASMYAAAGAGMTANGVAGGSSSPFSCPGNLTVYPPGSLTPVTYSPTAGCANDCSGNGFCVCGVCVCRAPYDGASDCSASYTDDSWNAVFTGDPLYSRLYGGMPVVDIRELHANAAQRDFLYEIFPRFVLAGKVRIGKFSNVTALESALTTLLSSAATQFSSRPGTLADYVTNAVVNGTIAGVTFEQSDLAGHKVFATLMTCDGQPVPTAYFTAVSPLVERCSENSYSIASGAAFATPDAAGVSNYESYSPVWEATDSGDPLGSIVTPPYADRRLLPRNVPSGCYRFKYSYGFETQGSFLQSMVPPAQAIQSGKAVSVGLSRPFRVLSPVVKISFVRWPSLFVPFDQTLPVSPVVQLTVRTDPSNPMQPLIDDCQLLMNEGLQYIDTPVLSRCPTQPMLGFPVYLSMVSYESGQEYPLYSSTGTNDCARAGNMSLQQLPGSPISFQIYTATFSGLSIPSNVEYPSSGFGAPLREGVTASVPKPGAYYLKATSFGTSVTSPFTITVVAGADVLQWDLPGTFAELGLGGDSAPGFPNPMYSVIGPAGSGLRIRALVDSQRGATYPGNTAPPANAERFTAAPNVLVTLNLVDGPLDAFEYVEEGSETAVTDINGYATFPNLRFWSGKSGRYVFLATASGVPCNRTAHSVAVNLQNPLAEIALTVNGQTAFGDNPAVAGASYATALIIDISQPRSVRIAACLKDVLGNPVDFANVTLYTLLDSADNKLPGSSEQVYVQSDWQAEANQTFCSSGYVLPATPYSVLETSQNGKTFIPSSQGCISVPEFTITGLSTSQRVAVMFLSSGVASKPIHLALLTPADARPFRFSDLQGQIPIPFALALAPLLANHVYLGSPLRLVILTVALAMIALFWIVGAQAFMVQLEDIFAYYEKRDGVFIEVIQIAYIIALSLITVSIVVSFVQAALKTMQDCCRAKRRIKQDNTGNKRTKLSEYGFIGNLVGSFDEIKHEALMRYASSRVFRIKTPLFQQDSNQLSVPFIEALAHAFAKYSRSCFAVDAVLPVVQLPAEQLNAQMWQRYSLLPGSHADDGSILLGNTAVHPTFQRQSGDGEELAAFASWGNIGVCCNRVKRIKCFTRKVTVNPMQTTMSATGVMRAKDFFMQLHTGCPYNEQTAHKPVGMLSEEEFIHICKHRLAVYGIASMTHQLRSMLPIEATDVLGSPQYALRYQVDSLMIYSDVENSAFFTEAGISLVRAAFHHVQRNDYVQSICNDPILRSSPTILAIFDPPLARMWYRLFSKPLPSLFDWIAAYHERLLSARDEITQISHDSRKFLDDFSIWGELRSWNFDRNLAQQPLLDENSLNESTYTILASAFAHLNTKTPPTPFITWQQLTQLRKSVDFPAIRKDHFTAAARLRLDAEALSTVNAASTFTSAASNTTAIHAAAAGEYDAVMLRNSIIPTLNDFSQPLLGPNGYAALASRLYTDADKHVKELLNRLGYTPRLHWRGNTVSLALRYKQALQNAGSECAVLVLAPDVKTVASAQLTSPVFFPQRLWISFALSLCMIMLLALVATNLTSQLSDSLNSAASELLLLQSNMQQTVLNAGGLGVSLTSAYLQDVLEGAATYLKIGPTTYTDAVMTAESITDFINGKASSVTAAVQVAADGVAAGSVGIETYVLTALSAANNVAGTVTSYIPSLPSDQSAIADTAAAAMQAVEEKLGNSLGSSALTEYAEKGAPQLLQIFTSGSSSSSSSGGNSLPFVNTIIAMADPDIWRDLATHLAKAVYSANAFAITLSCAIVLMSWFLLFYRYKKVTLEVRMGVYPFVYAKAAIGNASKYIGIQATLSGLTFFLVYVLLFALYVILGIPGFVAAVWQYGFRLVLGLLGVTLFIRILERILVNYLFSFKDDIKYRRLYMLADLWLSFVGMVIGVVAAVTRFIAAVPLIFIALMRADISPVPLQYEFLDSAKTTFNSVLLQDALFGNPIRYAFVYYLLESVSKKRGIKPPSTLNVALGDGITNISQLGNNASIAPIKSGAINNNSTMSATPELPTIINPLQTVEIELTATNTSPKLSTITNPLQTVEVEPVANSLQEAEHRHQSSWARIRTRRRALNRWHLAVLLHFNPSLRAERVKDASAEWIDHSRPSFVAQPTGNWA